MRGYYLLDIFLCHLSSSSRYLKACPSRIIEFQASHSKALYYTISSFFTQTRKNALNQVESTLKFWLTRGREVPPSSYTGWFRSAVQVQKTSDPNKDSSWLPWFLWRWSHTGLRSASRTRHATNRCFLSGHSSDYQPIFSITNLFWD